MDMPCHSTDFLECYLSGQDWILTDLLSKSTSPFTGTSACEYTRGMELGSLFAACSWLQDL